MSDINNAIILFPFVEWTEDKIKLAGGHFPYISYCLGSGCNGVIYGSPGDMWTFVYQDGQINFKSERPIFHCAPGDMERLRDNYPDLYSSFYEGKPVEFGRFHTIINMMIAARAQERVVGTCCVPWCAYGMDTTLNLMVGLRRFCKNIGFPLEVWCVPPKVLEEIQKAVMEVCIDLGGTGMNGDVFYLLCLRVLVCHLLRDVYGNYRLRNTSKELVSAQLLANTELFKMTDVLMIDTEFKKKCDEVCEFVAKIPLTIEQGSGPTAENILVEEKK